MKRYKFILLMLVASLAWGCQKLDLEDELQTSDSAYSNIEVLEDGRIRVTTTLEHLGMTSVESRASTTEDNIYNGWCLVFGETDNRSTNYSSEGYGDQSPLIQVVPITANANGTFFMTFDEFDDKALMRIVVNLTDRENTTLGSVVSWQDLAAANDELDATRTPDYTTVCSYRDNNGLATFGQFRHQSVGLDGIYDIAYNTTATLEYIDGGVEDYTGERVYYTINYQNSDANAQTGGENYLTKADESYNGNAPYPSTQLNTTTGFPMASYGFVLEDLSAETLASEFGTKIDMIRVCSKVVVDVSEISDEFEMEKVYLIDAPQEARIRSTVMSTVTEDEGEVSASTSFALPVDLGGLITYEAMPVTSGEAVSDPIYFYPNSGGDYEYSTTVDNEINPQYIIVKGQAAGYDTPGYYKVALKAQYPLVNGADPDALDDRSQWSELTYDILRNTFFTVKITGVDKPGYKTFEDAADVNSPANNISYSITIESDNNRYEILVSKGTYYVELETSRVYVKGYMDEKLEGCYVDFTMYPSEGNTVPTVYVQSSDHDGNANDNNVSITHCLVMRDGDSGYATDSWSDATQVDLSDNDTEDGLADKLVKIESSDKATKVRVYYDVTNSGRIRLRIGDILKFIPVTYDAAPISYKGTEKLVVTGTYGTTWSDFSYSSSSNIVYDEDHTNYVSGFGINTDGSVTYDNSTNYDTKPELRARISPLDAGDGNLVLYLRQASDFRLMDDDGEEIPDDSAEEGTDYSVIFHSQSMVEENNTKGLFTTSSDEKSIVFSTSSVGQQSVDALTISIDTEITTEDEDGNDPGWAEYFEEDLSEDKQTLTLSATTISYDYEGLDLTGVASANHKATRQAYAQDIYENTLVLFNNTATSTVTVTNAAGDTKTYTVKQIQYPPIYLVDASGQDLKEYSVSSSATPGVCVFALNIWNYDLIDTEGVTVTHEVTSSDTNGKNAFNARSLKCEFDKSYINSYDWTNDTGSLVSGTNFSGTTRTPDNASSITEIANMGGYYEADHIFGIVREASTYSSSRDYYAYVTIIITVTDKYGYTYSTKKYLYAEV